MVHNLGGRATTFVASGGWKDKLVEVLVSEQLENWGRDFHHRLKQFLVIVNQCNGEVSAQNLFSDDSKRPCSINTASKTDFNASSKI